MNRSVLVFTEDTQRASDLSAQLDAGGFKSVHLTDAQAAEAYLNDHSAGLCLSDVRSAHGLLNQSQVQLPPLMVVDEAADLDTAVAVVRGGAVDYVAAGNDELLTKTENHYRERGVGSGIFAAPASKRCAELARRVAGTDVSVLVTGESGTGKEVIARLIHDSSSRSAGPFIAINCAAIPENMLEAMLFGHVKGAFTGAVHSQPGKFELANGGTLLLDEISEMPLALQAKLLRVLQEREVERLGAREPVAVDVRVIATTNVNVKQAISAGTFREDLYYRLSVFPLSLQPLRKRHEDIDLLASHFVNKHAPKIGCADAKINAQALEKLHDYGWPGNVRELENVIQRALVLCCDAQIRAADLDLPIVVAERDDNLRDRSREAETEVILSALEANQQNRQATAQQLGISERTLRYKLKRMKDSGLLEK